MYARTHAHAHAPAHHAHARTRTRTHASRARVMSEQSALERMARTINQSAHA